MLVTLRRGATLEEHQIPVSIHGLGGTLRLSTRQGAVDLAAGELLALDAGVAHAAEASEPRAEGPVTIHVPEGPFRLSTVSAGRPVR